jgi:hypothetical protein
LVLFGLLCFIVTHLRPRDFSAVYRKNTGWKCKFPHE